MDAPQQAARSGGGAVTVTVLLKVAKMMLDVLKLLYQVVQLVYGGEMAAARGESGVEMGWGVVGLLGDDNTKIRLRVVEFWQHRRQKSHYAA